MTSQRRRSVLSVLLLLAATAVSGQEILRKPIVFPKGATSSTVTASLTGDATVDYTVVAKAGQTMTVTLNASNTANYFNVLPPGPKGAALFIGSHEKTKYTGALPADGTYAIRVYLNRSAAGRRETSTYTLTVAITSGPAGAARSRDAKVAGTAFHATGTVKCQVNAGPPADCAFGVVRGSSGHADVHVTSPSGAVRVLKFAGAHVTIADPALTLRVTRTEDVWIVTVANERYEIFDAVVNGG